MDWSDSPETIRRRQVRVATGMVGLSLTVTSQQALSILRAHASATSTTLDDLDDDLADDIVQRRFDVEELGSGTAS
ncbi:hypothetical protein [Kineococcus sp. R86509]|uniref:hypothetical protein n=1 Tax=Kineococcus sp. R86509 TaxID=3093851 RepID=UPI0036D34809